MNCCDDYGNCNQGRNCPIRKQREEMAIEDCHDPSWLPIVAVIVCVLVITLVLTFGGQW